jgi:hypothetical protein
MLTADRAYAAGEQVYATYGGGMSTAKKLLSFGYVEYVTYLHSSSDSSSSISSSSQSSNSAGNVTLQLPIDGTCEIVLPADTSQSSASHTQQQQQQQQQQHTRSDNGDAIEGFFRLLRTQSPVAPNWSTELNCEVLEWLQQQVLPLLRCHITAAGAQLSADAVTVEDAVVLQQCIAYIQQQAQHRLQQLRVADDVLNNAMLALQQLSTVADTASSGVTIVGTSDKPIACSVVRLGEALVWSRVLAVSSELIDSNSVITAEETFES